MTEWDVAAITARAQQAMQWRAQAVVDAPIVDALQEIVRALLVVVAEIPRLRTRLDCEAADGTRHCRVETPCRTCALRRLQAAEATLAQLREAGS